VVAERARGYAVRIRGPLPADLAARVARVHAAAARPAAPLPLAVPLDPENESAPAGQQPARALVEPRGVGARVKL